MRYFTLLRPYILYIFLVFSYFFSFFFRVSASVVLPHLADQWSMSASLTGFISSLYFYAYAFMQPVSGNLNDRYGPFRVISVGLFITSVGSIMFGYGSSPFWVGMGRLLTGLGLAPMLSGTLVFQASAFSVNRYAFFSGITFTIGNLGAVFSVSPLGYSIDLFGRSWAFLFLALLMIVLSLALVFNYGRDPVYRRASEEGREHISIRSIVRDLKKAFFIIGRTKNLRKISFFWAIAAGSILSFQGLWAVSWYETVYEVSAGTARFWATMIGIGVLIGSFVGAHIAPEAKDRKRAIVISGAVACVMWFVLVLSMYLRFYLPFSGMVGFSIGIALGVSFDHLTAGINDVAEPDFKGSLFGAVNLLTFIGVIIFQIGSGFFISLFPSTNGGYGAEGFNVTFCAVAFLSTFAYSRLLSLDSFDFTRGE